MSSFGVNLCKQCVICLLAVVIVAFSMGSVDVFSIGEGGYYCIKIPGLLVTLRGTLLAFSEGRWNSCSDSAPTDLVFKRSVDLGKTWSKLAVVYSDPGNQNATIGNACPVQLRGSGRILLSFCKDNREVFQTWSDDDGLTWAKYPEKIDSATRPDWKWIGTGPPGGIQLQSGRIVIPSYHSDVDHTNGLISRSHLMVNDDPAGKAGEWRIAAVAGGPFLTNECQAVEVQPNHLLVGSRGFLSSRIQTKSADGGESFQAPYWIGIPEPLVGCEGSLISISNLSSTLLFSGPGSIDPRRFNMTVWRSRDAGSHWEVIHRIREGQRAGYSSLQMMPRKGSSAATFGLLYERSNRSDFIFLPTEISFTVLPVM